MYLFLYQTPHNPSRQSDLSKVQLSNLMVLSLCLCFPPFHWLVGGICSASPSIAWFFLSASIHLLFSLSVLCLVRDLQCKWKLARRHHPSPGPPAAVSDGRLLCVHTTTWTLLILIKQAYESVQGSKNCSVSLLSYEITLLVLYL